MNACNKRCLYVLLSCFDAGNDEQASLSKMKWAVNLLEYFVSSFEHWHLVSLLVCLQSDHVITQDDLLDLSSLCEKEA